MSRSVKTLSDVDSGMLYRTGRLKETPNRGYVRLHLRCLNPASNKEHHNLPLPVAANDPSIQSHFAEIPLNLNSVEMLVYLGVTKSRAVLVWYDWVSRCSTS